MKDGGFDIALEMELSPRVVLFLRANSSGTALPCTWCRFCIYGTSGPIYGTGLREIKTTPRLGGVRGLRDGGIELILGGIIAGLRDWPNNLAGFRD